MGSDDDFSLMPGTFHGCKSSASVFQTRKNLIDHRWKVVLCEEGQIGTKFRMAADQNPLDSNSFHEHRREIDGQLTTCKHAD